jgi:hypothetical protein
VSLESPAEVDQLRRAPKGAYLLADQNKVDEILKVAGPLPRNEVLSRRVKSRTWVLFRLGEEARLVPTPWAPEPGWTQLPRTG